VRDRTDLDERLATGRQRLVDSIEQPPLAQITARAATLRRRRRAAELGGSLTAVLAVILLAVQWLHPTAGSPPGGGHGSAAPAPVWRGLGITLTGLPGTATELPGDVVDVQFADTDHGYLLTASCPSRGDCAVGFAATVDGGQSWQVRALPAGMRGAPADHLPRLWAAASWVAVANGEAASVSTDGGATWTPVPATGTNVVSVPAGGLFWLDTGTGQVKVWLGEAGSSPLYYQPPIVVRWVAPTRAGDGAWWAGGVDSAGRAALAVTRDGGARWDAVPLADAGPGAYEVRVATLGRTVYAAVLGPPGPRGTPYRQILAIYHSTDGGAQFRRTFTGGVPGTVSGDLVPLADDRLLVAGSDRRWYVSADHGTTFDNAPDLLAVGRIARTQAGYVAYDLLGGGWCAFSVDGSSWFKLNVK
jgi:photosystem II stability/assembly factor-like uncharacterized protein